MTGQTLLPFKVFAVENSFKTMTTQRSSEATQAKWEWWSVHLLCSVTANLKGLAALICSGHLEVDYILNRVTRVT
jgi:hypothetical protein